jgi:hypothetical protein
VRGVWGVYNGVDTAVGVDSPVLDDLGVPGSPTSPGSDEDGESQIMSHNVCTHISLEQVLPRCNGGKAG